MWNETNAHQRKRISEKDRQEAIKRIKIKNS